MNHRGQARTMPHIPPPLPWKHFSEPDADAEYLVVLTYLPVTRLHLDRGSYTGKSPRHAA
jgi:hypothetical protein